MSHLSSIFTLLLANVIGSSCTKVQLCICKWDTSHYYNYGYQISKVRWLYFHHACTIGGDDDGDEAVGFATLRQGDTGTDRLCNSTYETAITWACDLTKNWDSMSSTDATRFMTSYSLSLDKCFVSTLPIL